MDETILSVSAYSTLNLGIELADGIPHKIGIAYFTVAELLYDYLYKDKKIIAGQKYIFHSLFQSLATSLTTESYEKWFMDLLTTNTAVYMSS